MTARHTSKTCSGLMKYIQLLRKVGLRAESAAYPNMKPDFFRAADIAPNRLYSHVVNFRLIAVNGAAGNADFVLARQIGKIFIVEKKRRDFFYDFARVVQFVRVHARHRTAAHVARNVPTGAAGRLDPAASSFPITVGQIR